MKKALLCVLTLICIIGIFTLSGCKSGGEKKLDEKSEIVSVSLTLNDGYTTELNKDDCEFIKEQILSLGEFVDDSKILVAKKWDYEYDYLFKVTFTKKKLFKKTETTLYYRFGTTGIYTDSGGKKSERRFENEWTYLTAVGARRITDTTDERAAAIRARMDGGIGYAPRAYGGTTDERAAAIRARMDGLVSAERTARYEKIKQSFSNSGYSVRELDETELFSFENPFETGTYLVPDASAGFEASKSEGGSFRVYFCDAKTAKKLCDTLYSSYSSYSDVFFGVCTDPDSIGILKEVFAI